MKEPLAFTKYEGLGNDFLVVDGAAISSLTPEVVRHLCDRHRGVGGDGILVVWPQGPRMRVLNADGSVPEMCGNGLRCVVLHLAEGQGLRRGEVQVDTDAGLRACSFDVDAGLVTVDMGIIRVQADHVFPLRAAEGLELRVTSADAGNPHAVTFDPVAPHHHAAVGAEVGRLAVFPKGANVEFVTDEGDHLRVVVWERGVGFTEACGTGACAVAAVACAKGLRRHGEALTVRLPGGDLTVTVAEGGRTAMRGPARRVFEGRWRG